MGILLIGCAMNRYRIADQLFQQNDYQNALREYIRIAEIDGSITMSADVRALIGAMLSFYNLGQYKKSFALSKRILAIEKYNSSAIFYAGMNLEMLNKQSLAKKVYRYYNILSRSDPYYRFIKARFDHLVQEEMIKRAKLAIRMENSISMDQINDNTLAVLYFLNVMEDSEWNSLSKGLAEMIITDLSQVNRLRILERIQLQKLIEEMQLGMTGLADESTVPRMGRLLKARKLINGAFAVKAGKDIAITSNLVDVKTQYGTQSKDITGSLSDIFKIEKDIVFSTLDELGIPLTAEERNRIGKYATKNINAFKAFCDGLDEFDLNNYEAASMYFKKAIELDPNFMMARDMFDIADALGIIEQGKFSAMHFRIMHSPFSSMSEFGGGISTRERLNRLSNNLDLGYMPGNDSRNGGLTEIDERFWSDDWFNREILEAPPAPPVVPPNK